MIKIQSILKAMAVIGFSASGVAAETSLEQQAFTSEGVQNASLMIATSMRPFERPDNSNVIVSSSSLPIQRPVPISDAFQNIALCAVDIMSKKGVVYHADDEIAFNNPGYRSPYQVLETDISLFEIGSDQSIVSTDPVGECFTRVAVDNNIYEYIISAYSVDDGFTPPHDMLNYDLGYVLR